MSELSFEQMLLEQEERNKNMKKGSVVEGEVISVTRDYIVVNINYKSDGIIAKNEYSNDPSIDLTTAVHPGDSITVKILNMNDGDGQVVLSHKRATVDKVSPILEEAFANNTVLKAKVAEVVNRGLKVVVDDVAVFIPQSHASDIPVKDLAAEFTDKEVEFVLIEYDPKKRRIIGSCKQVIQEKKKALLETLSVGDVFEDATVKNVTKFGAFVDINGIDGLLHISEMSWSRINSPEEAMKKGDKVKVYIKDIKDDKIALSAKFDEDNPWTSAEEKYAVGTTVKGKIARMIEYGAFVQLEQGIDALLHVSEISNNHVDKPEDVFKVGDEIEAVVVGLDVENKKISLSTKTTIGDQVGTPVEDNTVETEN